MFSKHSQPAAIIWSDVSIQISKQDNQVMEGVYRDSHPEQREERSLCFVISHRRSIETDKSRVPIFGHRHT